MNRQTSAARQRTQATSAAHRCSHEYPNQFFQVFCSIWPKIDLSETPAAIHVSYTNVLHNQNAEKLDPENNIIDKESIIGLHNRVLHVLLRSSQMMEVSWVGASST